MTYTAMTFHDELLNEGFDASSEEYYNEIDRRIRKEFPHKFEDQSKPKQKLLQLYEQRPLDAAL